jgi:hypothetical protein
MGYKLINSVVSCRDTVTLCNMILESQRNHLFILLLVERGAGVLRWWWDI